MPLADVAARCEAAARAATATLVQSINNRRALMEGPVA